MLVPSLYKNFFQLLVEPRPENISLKTISDNMSLSVSNLSNVELESLLKEIFADGETMNDRLPSLDQPVDDLA